MPITRAGGEVIALKGSKAADEIADSKRLQKKLQIQAFEILTVGATHLAEPTTVVRTKLD